MRFDQADLFPECHKLLSTRLAAYAERRENRVAAAFYEMCENDELATQALTWGKDPLVSITDLPQSRKRQVYGRYQGEHGGPRDEVFIDVRVARICEYHRVGHVQFEATVLEEMIHWARCVGHKPLMYWDREFGVQPDPGEPFQIKAYGMIVPRGWPSMGRRYARSRD